MKQPPEQKSEIEPVQVFQIADGYVAVFKTRIIVGDEKSPWKEKVS
jgi:hypothetical protein